MSIVIIQLHNILSIESLPSWTSIQFLNKFVTIFSLIIAQVTKSSTVSNDSIVYVMCEKINTQSPIVAHACIRSRPHVLVPV